MSNVHVHQIIISNDNKGICLSLEWTLKSYANSHAHINPLILHTAYTPEDTMRLITEKGVQAPTVAILDFYYEGSNKTGVDVAKFAVQHGVYPVGFRTDASNAQGLLFCIQNGGGLLKNMPERIFNRTFCPNDLIPLRQELETPARIDKFQYVHPLDGRLLTDAENYTADKRLASARRIDTIARQFEPPYKFH